MASFDPIAIESTCSGHGRCHGAALLLLLGMRNPSVRVSAARCDLYDQDGSQ